MKNSSDKIDQNWIAILSSYISPVTPRKVSLKQNYNMLQPPPSAILETVAGCFPSSTPFTISTVSAMSGKFMVANLVWMTVPLTVTSKELRRPTLPRLETFSNENSVRLLATNLPPQRKEPQREWQSAVLSCGARSLRSHSTRYQLLPSYVVQLYEV